MKTTIKIPVWFWIISVLALLWNIMGVMAYIGQAFMTDEVLATLPEGEQNFYNNTPAWVTAAFAIAVFAGAIGCIALLLRKKWASPLLLLSLIAVLAQATYNFFLQNFVQLSGNRVIMPIIVIIVAIFLVWFSRNSKAKGLIS
ncbi:hypothetical protein ATE84_3320 [Aquimarina sp. MAR_2010_214]|uniref:hypothetical protein n=1 Tax=Aquimarina sp. MAR_2010_214 TaxID=1250026 RepID=UPI000C70BFB4|nr:hypothetical protein [Aquimarina sp. MAR_2010_214]PKV51246.1 hypothetical protein ATE84_3320 [Aquimarina sp. MAR_2010_214]